MLGNFLINPSIIFVHFSHLLFSVHDLHSILLKFPVILSTSPDNEVDINLKLSMNLSLYEIVLPLSHSFLIGSEEVIYFSIFSPIKSSSPLNSSANWLIINEYHN